MDYDGPLRGSHCFVDNLIENTRRLPEVLIRNGFSGFCLINSVNLGTSREPNGSYSYITLPNHLEDPIGNHIDERIKPVGITHGFSICSYFLRKLTRK